MSKNEELERKVKIINEHIWTGPELRDFNKALYDTKNKIINLRKAREVPEWKEQYMQISPIHHISTPNNQNYAQAS